MITNRANLPAPIVAALLNDPYDGPGITGDRVISVSRLIGPAQIAALTRAHVDEIETDASDMLWALLGQAVHHVIERASSRLPGLCEARFDAVLDGWTISGQIDYLHANVLQDYKVTSAWSVVYGKEEWIRQLNCYRWLLSKHGKTPERLEIVALCRDFDAKQVGSRGYPAQPMVTLPLEVWPLEKAEEYLRARIADHEIALCGMPPACTDSERWMRKGTPARCHRYCSVSSWCSQFKDAK